MPATTNTPPLIPARTVPGGATRDYWWEQELDWADVMGHLGLDAFEVLIELECSARELHRQALVQVLDDLALDPSLGWLRDELVELEPWQWLRSTPTYRGLERLAFPLEQEPWTMTPTQQEGPEAATADVGGSEEWR